MHAAVLFASKDIFLILPRKGLETSLQKICTVGEGGRSGYDYCGFID